LLDIGCGPADILDALPPGIDYTGFDPNERYVKDAQRRFGQRGKFHCRQITTGRKEELSDFDLVLACGVLHHLDDSEVMDLFSLAKAVLNSGGRLITIDGCLVRGQSRIARLLLDQDRGQFVRTEAAYLALASKVFGSVTSHIRHDLMRIPYTHLIIELRP
jgi:cyclopropane fatty-acyl-phospholipid synthase-like methyltransferase